MKLKYWTRMGLDSIDFSPNPYITLYEDKTGMMCEVFGNTGEIVFYPAKNDSGFSKGFVYYEWLDLLDESQSVCDEYFPKFDKLTDYGDLMPIEEFKGLVGNMFLDSDGHGYYAIADKESDVMVRPSDIMRFRHIPTWATHVIWYNK